MNEKQRLALQRLCERYGVPFIEKYFTVYAADDNMMAGYAEGWVGRIYVGCSSEGEIHS